MTLFKSHRHLNVGLCYNRKMRIERFGNYQAPQEDPKAEIDPVVSEQEWHAERWQRKSESKDNQDIFGRTRKDAEDFMIEEADRDNADFEKRKHAEFEMWQADLRVVIDNFKAKLENPEKKSVSAIYMKGGGMKSAYTGGQVWALNQMGITSDKIDYIFGSSSGSVVAAAYAGGPEETKKGLNLLTGPLSSKDFINPNFRQLLKGNVINLGMAEQLMSEGEYALDQDKIRSTKGKLYFSVTEPATGKETPAVRFLDMKDSDENPSIPNRIRSSMTIPGLTGEIPTIDGQEYYDGDFNQLPIEEVIDQIKRTLPEGQEDTEINILILPQTPFELMDNIEPSQTEYNLASLTTAAHWAMIGKSASLTQTQKLLLARAELRKDLEDIQKTRHVNIGIMWPPNDDLGTLNIDSDNARASIISSARDTVKQFGGEQPDFIVY